MNLYKTSATFKQLLPLDPLKITKTAMMTVIPKRRTDSQPEMSHTKGIQSTIATALNLLKLLLLLL